MVQVLGLLPRIQPCVFSEGLTEKEETWMAHAGVRLQAGDFQEVAYFETIS